MFPISLGAQIFFAEGVEALTANMLEARPTIVTAVPRYYEISHRRIHLEAKRQGAVEKSLLDLAATIGRKPSVSQQVGFGERLIDALLDRLARSKLRASFGGRLKAMISAGAPLNPEIGSFFLALGIRLLQGYAKLRPGWESVAIRRHGSRSTRSARRSKVFGCASQRMAKSGSRARMS